MPRRIVTAREYYELLSPWLLREAVNVQDYRDERHRQELELEKATGGYATDKADYFARGGDPLITYKDWLKSQKMGDAEQAARQGPVSREVYTPDPARWGTDNDLPAWATTASLGHRLSSFGDDVMRRLEHDSDGMTTKRDMRPAPEDGYMVSDRDAEDVVPEHEMNAERANKYLHEHPAIDQDEEAHYGLWHQSPDYYQDTSRLFENVGPHDESSAADQALKNNQIAIWDNRQNKQYNTSDLVGSGGANAMGFYHSRRWYR